MFGLGSKILGNISENASIVLNGFNGNPIPIVMQQATSWPQFLVSTGTTLLVGGGILFLPMILSGNNPIKKAKNIKQFNKITGRPSLIIDHSKNGLFKPSMIDNKTVKDVLQAMIKLNGRDFNIVLQTGGGGVFQSQLISDAMQKYKGQIHIYIPAYSMSGGTLLALSATHIHMTEYSSLGMLDPQIGSLLSSGSQKGWEKVIETKGSKANDNSILHNLTGQQVVKSLRENIYSVIKGKTNKSDEVVDYLTSGKYEHIKQVKRDKLLELGFNNVFEITKQEQKLLSEMVG